MWVQHQLTLPAYPRGFHLITDSITSHLPELLHCQTGLLHVFIQHSSASLTINENADPTVRMDFESHFNVIAPENQPYYRHTYEGPDDMPAHLKASLLGSSVVFLLAMESYYLVLGKGYIWESIGIMHHLARLF